MAKLTGVKTIDMVNGEITKVAYGGAEYAKVDGGAQESDLIYVTKAWGNQSVGEYFEDIGEEHMFYDPEDRGDMVYIDGNKNHASIGRQSAEVFRKISAQATPTIETVNAKVDGLAERVSALENVEAGGKQMPKTEKRYAKVGERILITKAEPIYSQSYETGDILTVTKTGVCSPGDVHVEGQSKFIDYREYEVIVESTDEPAKEITHNGVEYTLVDRKAQAGDVVVFTETNSPFFTNGKVYGPVFDGDKIYDNTGDGLSVYFSEFRRTEANTLVYAPKVESLKVGDYVVMVETKTFFMRNYRPGDVAIVDGFRYDGYVFVKGDGKEREHMNPKQVRKATAEEIAEATKPKPIREGDVVVITANTNSSRNKVGDIGKLNRWGDVDVPNRPNLGDSNGNYTRPSEMRHATPAEIAEYERAYAEANKPKLKIGDYAKVVGKKTVSWYVAHSFGIGEVVRVDGVGYGEGAIKCRQMDGDDYDFFHPLNLVKATDEEVAEAKAQAARNAIFTKAGRKLNEYRKGDIVRVVNNYGAMNVKKGDIVVVESHNNSGSINDNKYGYSLAVEPLVFVENRLDTQK